MQHNASFAKLDHCSWVQNKRSQLQIPSHHDSIWGAKDLQDTHAAMAIKKMEGSNKTILTSNNNQPEGQQARRSGMKGTKRNLTFVCCCCCCCCFQLTLYDFLTPKFQFCAPYSLVIKYLNTQMHQNHNENSKREP